MFNTSWARRASVVGLGMFIAMEAACFEPPILPEVGPRRDARSFDAWEPEEASLHAFDANGMELPLDALARHVEFDLRPASADIVLLLPAALDALRDADLRARRLSERLVAEAIPLNIAPSGDHLRLTSSLYAEPDSRWSLVAVTQGEDGRISNASVWPLHVLDGPDGGARVIASWPAEGTARVPLELHEVSLQLDGEVDLSDAFVLLTSEGGEVRGELAEVPCEALGFEGGTCVRWLLPHALYPRTEHQIAVRRLRDRRGADVPPFVLTFATGEDAAYAPHARIPTSCPIDEIATPWGCVLQTDQTWSLALSLDTPSRVELTVEDRIVRALAPRGDVELALDALQPGMRTPATITMTSLSGMALHTEILVTTHAALAPIVIREVCANPSGDEPAQEWVELQNVGDEEASLEGLHIADRMDAEGTDIGSDRMLLPREHVLLVGDAFDPDAAGVLPGATLIRVGRTIVSSGITNRGEALYLRDAMQRRLAFVPAMEGFEDRCVIRREEVPMRRDVPESFDYAACTPGR